MWRAGKKPGRRESPSASNQEPATPERSTSSAFAFAPASTPQSISSPDFNFGRSSDCSPGTSGSWLTKGQASPSEAINPSLVEDMWFGRPSASQTSSAASPGVSPGVSSRTPATAGSAGSAPSTSVDRTLDQAAAALKEQAAQSGSARIPFKPTYHTPLDKSQPVPPAPHSTPADAAAAAGASPDVTSAAPAADTDTDVDVPSHKGAADQGAAAGAAAPGSASKASPARDQNTPAGAVEPWGHLSPQVLDFGSASKTPREQTLSPDSAVSIGSHLGARPDPTQLDFDAVADTPGATTPTLLQRSRSPVSIKSPSELPTPENASPVLPSSADNARDMSPGQRKQLDDLLKDLAPETREAARSALFGGDASEMTARLDPYHDVEVKESKGWASKALLGISLVALMVGAVFMAHGPPLGFVPSVHNVAPLLQAYSKGLAWEAPAPATGWKKYVHAAKYAIQDIVDPGRALYSRVEPALAETLQVLRRHNIKLPGDTAAATEASAAAGGDPAAAAAAAQQQAPQEVSPDAAAGGDVPAASQDAPAVTPPAAPEAAAPEAPVEQAPAAPVQQEQEQEQEAVPVEAAPVEPAPAATLEEAPTPAADTADEAAEAEPGATGEHEVAPPAPEEAQQEEEMPPPAVEEPAAPVILEEAAVPDVAEPAAQPAEEPAAGSSDVPDVPPQQPQEPEQQPAAHEELPATAAPEQQLDASSAPDAVQPTEEPQAPAVVDVVAPSDAAVLVEPAPEVVPDAPSAADEPPAAAEEQPGVVPGAEAEQQQEQLQAQEVEPEAPAPEVVEAPAPIPAEEPLLPEAEVVEEEAPLTLEYVSSPGAEAKPWERAEAVADERLASEAAMAVRTKLTMFQATNFEMPLHMWAGLAVVVLAVIGVVAMYLVGSAIEVGADKAAAEAAETAEEDSLAAVSDLPPSFDQLKAPLDVDSLPAKLARRISLGAEAAKEAISELTGSTVHQGDDDDDEGTTSKKRTPAHGWGGRKSKAAAAAEAAAEEGEPEGQHTEGEEEEEAAAAPASSRGRRKSAASPRSAAPRSTRKPRASALQAIVEDAPLAAAAAAAPGRSGPALGDALSEEDAEPAAPAPSTRTGGSRGRAKSAAAAVEQPAGSGPVSGVSAGRAARNRNSAPLAVPVEPALEGNSERATRTRGRRSAV